MFQKTICARVALSLLLTMTLILGLAEIAKAVPPQYIMKTDVRSGSFVVSWTTATPSNGSVTWGLSKPPTNVVSDSVTSTTSHWVRISGLSPNTTYYFQVTSEGNIDNNGGEYYQVTTGPVLPFTIPVDIIQGYVYRFDGVTVVPNAIVYLQLHDANSSGSAGDSQWVSVRANASGYWIYSLVNVRTSDFQNYFTYTPGADQLRVIGQGGINGTKGYDPNPWVMNIPSTSPYRLDIVLDRGPTDVGITDFAGSTQGVPPLAWGGLGLAALGLALVGGKKYFKTRTQS